MSKSRCSSNHLSLSLARACPFVSLFLCSLSLSAALYENSPTFIYSVVGLFTMAPLPRTRLTADTHSGGKIVRKRRSAAARTPYDRPVPVAPPPTESPNWFGRVVVPATRLIATGATKIFSSVFRPDASSSSSSSLSLDSDTSSGNGIDNEDDKYDIPSDGVGEYKGGTSSGMAICYKEPQLTVPKSETKGLIEQLLMRETFSREERDRMINIINSRALGGTMQKEHGTSDLCNKAVMEAKKWLGEKKGNEGLVGSPVDMAKSYMRARPPWASPSTNFNEAKTSSPLGMELLKETTPQPIDLVFSTKKRDSLSSGSWNIQEELRRVRSKATEDMLKTLSSTKMNLSSLGLESLSSQGSRLADKIEADALDKVRVSNFLTTTKLIDASLNLAPASEKNKDTSRVVGDSSFIPAVDALANNQDLEAIQVVEVGAATSESHKAISVLDLAPEQLTGSTSRNCSAAEDLTELTGRPIANGFPSPELRHSLPEGHAEQIAGHSDDMNPYPASPSNEKKNEAILVEETTCELLRETDVEVPVMNETNDNDGGSENSAGTNLEGLSQEATQQNSKRGLSGKTNSAEDKPPPRRSGRYNRKGRGRGQ